MAEQTEPEAAPPIVAPMVAPKIVTHADGAHPHKRRQNIMVFLVLAGFGVLLVVLAGVALGPQWMAFWSYTPQEGDIVFQSTQATPVVEAIETATKSPLSQVGIVSKDADGQWVVYEVYGDVQATPLRTFLFRGRSGAGYLIYRLKSEEQSHVPAMVKYAQERLGKPEDPKLEWSDNAYYSAELVYKAYAAAAGGESLGKLVTLGDLKSKELEKIMRSEDDLPPLETEIITPREIAKAKQLELVTSYQLEAPKPAP